ncbi:putative cucumisin [Helianthus annuus]|uniref:Cucumisin n=1 Tax=Helianthus annuus TaxID=4232 RepID=A0A251UHC8_HELAN|nr:subtilisin-like protease [Helianthus annuus]KAF5801963.1 putative cucumisin [Helianthus annuus]KAJ0911463.1 putative cucumisin [Helianthus annuus]
MLPTIGLVLVLTCTTILNVFPTKADDLKTYIVHLSLPDGQDFSQAREIEEWYNSFLSKVASLSNENPKMVYVYRHVITGFAAKMSVDQAKAIENLSGVASVRPEGMYQLQTTRSSYFLGLRQDSGLWKDSNKGKGVIIGVIDSGITPGHPSFNDNGVPTPPSTWKGKCEVAGCNNKLIGIRNFVNGSSPIDKIGHGTHTSSTAAGNSVDNANVFGMANGTASGMAPLAHLAMYKVCYSTECWSSDILAGMDAAIADGVNVMSISLGGGQLPFHEDSTAIAAFSAIQKGIFVSFAAGNGGPLNSSLSNEAPWMLTVGASTIDRRIRTSVLLGNKKIFDGESLYQPKGFDHKLRPLVHPGKDGDLLAALCVEGSLDQRVKCCFGTMSGTKTDPEVSCFSSRGPNFASPGILKPDIIGPGVDILAAWNESVDHQTGTKAAFNVVRGTSMACPHLAGIAALIKSVHPEWSPAAIKSAIMTTASQVGRNGHAIIDERDLPADVFATGSGHVNPPKAHEPGLVFDIQPDDYIPYLCGLGYTPKQIQLIVKKKVNCSKTIPEAQLNYPSFAISLKRGDSKTYTRTVTNVGVANSTYTIGDISVPPGVSINVEGLYGSQPQELSFTGMQQKLIFKVTFTRSHKDKGKDPYGQGHMTWISGKYTVRTPFSFKFE